MRMLIASAVYVSLSLGVFAQQPNEKSYAESIRQISLINTYRDSGNYPAAERALRELLTQQPTGSVPRTTVQDALADLLREEGRNAEARQLFNQIVDAPGATSRQRLSALTGLADVDQQQANWKTSIDEWNAALETARREGDAREEAVILRGLGRTWLNAGSTARAEPLLRRSLRMVESDREAGPLDVATSLVAMGEYYSAGNKLALAEDAFDRALAMERAVLGDNHPQVALVTGLEAEVYSRRGESDLACDYARRSADLMRQWFGDGATATATAMASLALVEQRAHTLGAAAGHYESALRILRRSPELHATMQIVMRRYAGVLKAMHRDREAKALDTEVKAFRLN